MTQKQTRPDFEGFGLSGCGANETQVQITIMTVRVRLIEVESMNNSRVIPQICNLI